MVTFWKDFPGEMSELYVEIPLDYNQNGIASYVSILQILLHGIRRHGYKTIHKRVLTRDHVYQHFKMEIMHRYRKLHLQ